MPKGIYDRSQAKPRKKGRPRKEPNLTEATNSHPPTLSDIVEKLNTNIASLRLDVNKIANDLDGVSSDLSTFVAVMRDVISK